MNVIAIDPGSDISAYCVINDRFEIAAFEKIENIHLLSALPDMCDRFKADVVVIERVASYGMPVGREVFDTCEWIGRFTQIAAEKKMTIEYVYRLQEKTAICHSAKATDATIRHALIDRFAKHDKKTGKGTKANPDYFYGFSTDCWQAFAVGVTFLENFSKGRDSVEK